MAVLLFVLVLLCPWLRPGWRSPRRRATAGRMPGRCRRSARKPAWVREAVIRFKAMQPDDGCRTIATTFNRLYATSRNTTVGKTWVAETLRRHRYEVERVRERVRGRKGRPGLCNRVWGLDLTGKKDTTGNLHGILGLIDHGSRACLSLQALRSRSSITMLRVLLSCIERFGQPQAVRTDNEAVFTSRLFRFGLRWLGIRHETTDLHCPWMNGRVERFFGTLKHKLDRWAVPDPETLNRDLARFRQWYNFVRPHQSLYGCTPAEAWNGVDINRRRPRRVIPFSAWEGLLSGFYIPP